MIEIEEKILKYLQKRKTASTIKQVSSYFNITYSYAGTLLRNLSEQKLINGIRAGGTKLYVFNYQRSSTEVRSAPTKDRVLQQSQGSNKEPDPSS